MKRIQITWVDSYHHATDGPWCDREEVEKAAKDGFGNCVSIGFLVSEDDDQVTIALGHDEDRLLLAHTVPRCAILDIAELVGQQSLRAAS